MLRYFDHVLPVRPGTRACPCADLLAAQHYRLADWRDRRDRAELAAVLRHHHADRRSGSRTPTSSPPPTRCCCGWCAEGLIDGLRVDHPDGLADPRGYLRPAGRRDRRRLGRRREDPGAGEDSCPPTGPAPGTTGYDAWRWSAGCSSTRPAAAPLTAEYVRVHRRRRAAPARRAGGRDGQARDRRAARWPPRWPGWPGWLRPGRRPGAGRRRRRRTCTPC